MSLDISRIRDDIFTKVYHHLAKSAYQLNDSTHIHSAYNDSQYKSEGSPQIIITDILIKENQITLGRDGLYEIPYSFMIHTYHNTSEGGRKIVDEVSSKFRGEAKNALRNDGFKRLTQEDDSYTRLPYGPKSSIYIYHLNILGNFIGVAN